ncbi:MAG: 4Fe-4S binding protein, partial [Verrucomicrobiales bacterium]
MGGRGGIHAAAGDRRGVCWAIALDPDGTIIRKLKVRDSFETEEYLAIVTRDSRFLPSFSGRTTTSMREFDFQTEGVSGVSGATRTSLAILEGVRRRLGADSSGESSQNLAFALRDGLVVAIVIFAGILSFTHWRGIRWVRWLWQAVLIGYLGLTGGDLVSQALLAGWAEHGLPWRTLPGLVVLTGAALLVPLFTGKQIYCFHLCPHGAAQHWLGKLSRRKIAIPPRFARILHHVPGVLLGGVFLLVLGGT